MDNTIGECINGIIKQEWFHKMKRPHNLDETRRGVSGIIEFYNTTRLNRSNRDILSPRKIREGKILHSSKT